MSKSAKHYIRNPSAGRFHYFWCECDEPDEQPVDGVFGALGAKRCVHCERPTYRHLRRMA